MHRSGLERQEEGNKQYREVAPSARKNPWPAS